MSGKIDHKLLADFVQSGSETAFTELVQRYIALVYSTALRFSNNPHHAEEITQAVFIILARKANVISSRVILSGWLYQTARLTAANFVKREIRRGRREQEVFMQSTLPHSECTDWDKIAPLLDTAMGKLGETDRNALVLRFFENHTAAEIGAALRMNEESARKRVQRALGKLRKFFGDHGVNSTEETIAGAISANSVRAVPVELAAVISRIALSRSIDTPILTKIMTLFLKIFATAAVATAIGVTVYALHLQKQNQALQQQESSFTGQIQQLQQQFGDATNQIDSLKDENASLASNMDDLMRLRAEVTQFHRDENPSTVNISAPHDPTLRIFIQSGFYFVSDSDLQRMGIQWAASSQSGEIGYLDASQLVYILEALNGASDVTALTAPRLVSINGQTVQISISRSYSSPGLTYTNLGEFLSAKPFYSTNSSTFDFNFDAEIKQLTGDPSQPTVQTIEITNDVTFPTGKTLVLEQPVPPGSWMPYQTNTLVAPQNVLIFVTPTVIDSKQSLISRQQQL